MRPPRSPITPNSKSCIQYTFPQECTCMDFSSHPREPRNCKFINHTFAPSLSSEVRLGCTTCWNHDAAMTVRTARPINVWVPWPILKQRFGRERAKDLKSIFRLPKRHTTWGVRLFLIPWTLWRDVAVPDDEEDELFPVD